MTTLDANIAYKNLRAKGFVGSKVKYKDYKYFEFYHNDQLILHTKVSKGEESQLGPAVVHQMAYQCGLSDEQFMALATGDMTQEEYVAILREQEML